ncbi:MAG: hypothetical protein ACP5I8_15210 [Phycisphaerae bacterium]
MFLFPTTVPENLDERKMLRATQLPIPQTVTPQLHPATAGLGATVHGKGSGSITRRCFGTVEFAQARKGSCPQDTKHVDL